MDWLKKQAEQLQLILALSCIVVQLYWGKQFQSPEEFGRELHDMQ